MWKQLNNGDIAAACEAIQVAAMARKYLDMLEREGRMTYGYARVSTANGTRNGQIISLTGAGVQRENIDRRKAVGQRDFDRPLYIRTYRQTAYRRYADGIQH